MYIYIYLRGVEVGDRHAVLPRYGGEKVYICMCMYIYICMYMSECVYIYIIYILPEGAALGASGGGSRWGIGTLFSLAMAVRKNVYIYIYIYIYVYVCVYIYTYVCVYILYIHTTRGCGARSIRRGVALGDRHALFARDGGEEESIYIYIYICVCVCIYILKYINILKFIY